MIIIDSHAHLQHKAFLGDREELMLQMVEKHIGCVIVGDDLKSSTQAVSLASQHRLFKAAVGIHPEHVVDRDWRAEANHIRGLLGDLSIGAIGEIGLDYYRLPDDEYERRQIINDQKRLLSFFIDIAAEHRLPIVAHVRSAYDDWRGFLSDCQSRHIKGVIHSFAGNDLDAARALKAQWYLGFNGLITFSDEWDEIIKNIPLDSLLVETDSPFLTPVPNRGKRNDPTNIRFVIKKIAELKKLSEAEVAKQTARNAARLFRLDIPDSYWSA